MYGYPIQLKNAHKHRVIAVAGVLNMAVNNHLVNKAFVFPASICQTARGFDKSIVDQKSVQFRVVHAQGAAKSSDCCRKSTVQLPF